MTSNDFIEVYEDALPRDACATLLRRFETNGGATRGMTGGGLDLKHKNSWDITLTGNPAWADVEQMLNGVMLGGLMRYVRKYAFAVLGPHWLNLVDPVTRQKRPLDAETLAGLPDDMLQAIVTKAFRPGGINLQKYVADEGGFPTWHCEVAPKADRCESLHRTLLWTLYLNEEFAGGETEFYYQSRKLVPRTGALLIAPATFTHTHRGNTPKGGDKYIATSWILFQRVEPA